MSIINFNDYYQAKRLSQLDNENPIIHENMETLATLLPKQNKNELSDEFVDLAHKVNKLIKYDLPNLSLLERSSTRMSFLLKRTEEREAPTMTEQIEDLKSIGDDFIASISHVNLKEDYYTEVVNKKSKLLRFLFRVCNLIALCVSGYIMQKVGGSLLGFPFFVAGISAIFLVIIDSVGLAFGLFAEKQKTKSIREIASIQEEFNFYIVWEYSLIILNPLVFIIIQLSKRDIENVWSTVLHSNKIININNYLNAPEKLKKQINELSKYELPESYSIKLNEILNQISQEGLSYSDRESLRDHFDCFNECLSLLNEK